jgi:lipopolysaccharide/colanic/teichoic acid biosynthesis glycosyltransferase
MKQSASLKSAATQDAWTDPHEPEMAPALASWIKRALDVSVAAVLFVFLLPLLALIALMVKLSDGGPILYVAQRCGVGGKIFGVLKFRTMHMDANDRLARILESDPAAKQEWDTYEKLRNDPRVTPLGNFLRRTSLDELPQLVNIFRGEMSLIGPRPVAKSEVYRWGPYFAEYVRVRPGVLGLWQVSGRSKLTYQQRVQLDVKYVNEWSFLLDMKILMLGVPAVIFGVGAF